VSTINLAIRELKINEFCKEVDSACPPEIGPYVKGRHNRSNHLISSNQSRSTHMAVFLLRVAKLNVMYAYFGKHA
jgi:hypothetical protein